MYSRRTVRRCLVLLPALAFLSMAIPALGQIPDSFTNLQVLSEDISKGELIGVMRGFAGALGVRCNHCHVGEDGNSLEGFDFASDEKESKRAARLMLEMTQNINAEVIPKVGHEETDRVEVKCVTCHRGQERPWMIEDVLAKANAEGGTEALLGKYASLREEHYGRHTYDFGEFVLTGMAENLARTGDMEGAEAVLVANLEHFPESIYSRMLRGQLAAQTGNQAKAVSIFEEILEMDPENGRAKQMLERLKQ